MELNIQTSGITILGFDFTLQGGMMWDDVVCRMPSITVPSHEIKCCQMRQR